MLWKKTVLQHTIEESDSVSEHSFLRKGNSAEHFQERGGDTYSGGL